VTRANRLFMVIFSFKEIARDIETPDVAEALKPAQVAGATNSSDRVYHIKSMQ